MRLLVVAGLALAGAAPLLAPRAPVAVRPATPFAPARFAPPPHLLPAAREELANAASRPARDAAGRRGASAHLACSTSQAAINPCTTSVTATTNRTIKTQFTIQNKSTIENTTYVLSFTCTGKVTTCSAPGSVYIPKSSSKSVDLTWVSAATAGSGVATFTADDGFTPVTGTLNATVNLPPSTGLFVAQVSPHLQRHLVDSGQADTARFVLRNAGADSTGWTWAVTCTGAAISGACSLSSGTVALAAVAQTTLAVTYTTTGAVNAAGAAVLKLWQTTDTTRRDSGAVE